MVLWMRVTDDELELPLCVSPSLPYLAHKYGVAISTIINAASRKSKWSHWKKVIVSDEEGND
ncbi:MAG: hypothetical protein IKG25_05280 [Mogibacterium sp.]|nr:hypothetical protein [Mogibacterium sp.]